MDDSRDDGVSESETHLVIKGLLDGSMSHVVAAVDREGRIAFNLMGQYPDVIDILKCFKFTNNKWSAAPSITDLPFFLSIPRESATPIQDSSEFLIGHAHFVFRQDTSKPFPWAYLDLVRSKYPEGFRFPIIKPEGVIIGREPSTADIPLVGDNWVSRRHARVFRVDSQYLLEDFNTPNGTFKRMTDDFYIRENAYLYIFDTIFSLSVQPGGMEGHPEFFRLESKQIRAERPRKAREANSVVQPPVDSELGNSRIGSYLTDDRSQVHPKTLIDELLSAVPEGAPYEEQAGALKLLGHAFRKQVGARLQPALNERIQGMARDTLEEKKVICDFVNGELETLGLAVLCPNTGMPAKLKATSGDWPGVGRFQYEIYRDGKRIRSFNSNELPLLELTDTIPPPEPTAQLQGLAEAKPPRRSPKRGD